MSSALHIVSFDIPFPANYGGVIDVFYKITALHRAGIRIRLHCYRHDRQPAPELEQYCEEVRYYARASGWSAMIGLKPYIVAGRMSEELIMNLQKDQDPILFEGLHTCGIMQDPRLKGRFMAYRESNIEHHYYYHLFKAERNLFKRFYFLAESTRLYLFQPVLHHASVLLAVSTGDAGYLSRRFPVKRVEYLPSFHRDDKTNILPGKGDYALYQGKLTVPENLRAAEYLITRVWRDELPALVIAGLDPPAKLQRLAAGRPNIRIISNPTDEEMFRLIREAHVNVMVTFQPTGLKLKLINALFNGRFCLVNPPMVAGTTLGTLCTMAGNPIEFREELLRLFATEFTADEARRRESLLSGRFSNQNNCISLLEILNLR